MQALCVATAESLTMSESSLLRRDSQPVYGAEVVPSLTHMRAFGVADVLTRLARHRAMHVGVRSRS